MPEKKDNITNKSVLGENIYSGPLFIILAIIAGYIFKYAAIPETNIAIAFLLAVVAISIFTQNYVISLFYSVMATLAFNYFFTIPYMAFEIANASYIITFIIMVTVSLIISMLTQRIKRNAVQANQRAEENKALYIFTNQLSAAYDIKDIVHISIRNISRITDSKVIMAYLDNPVSDTSFRVIECEDGTLLEKNTAAAYSAKNFAQLQADSEHNPSIRQWSLAGSNELLAVVHMPYERSVMLDDNQRRILMVMLESAAMAMDRYRATEKQNHLLQENERERYRSSLLRSISHDLRTPLSGIMGTSEMIMDMTEKSDSRYELAQEIRQDADWLHSLMENILNLTRLEEGNRILNKQPEAVEEIVGVTLERFEKRAPDRDLIVDIPDELMLIPMDAKLIIQVLMNLLDNSLKHTTQEQEISLTVTNQGDTACFTVADRGAGISEEDLPYIFQMYYTSSKSSADSQKGMGLGLAICDAVVKAHGGTITAANRAGGGAIFTFTLPVGENTDE